jgi:pyruvate carboxylase
VKAGQVMAVMSAMKMETTVAAPCNGVVTHVAVITKDLLDVGDLMLRISAEESSSSAAPSEAATATA